MEPKVRRRRNMIIVLSGKGGAGKSVVARLLAETLREAVHGIMLVDGNGTVGQLLQYLGARGDDGKLLNPQPKVGGVQVVDLHGDERDRDGILEVAQTDADMLLFDLPAESLHIVERLQRDLGMFDVFGEYGFDVTVVLPMTPYRASVRDVQTALALAPVSRHVIVRNLAFGAAEDPARNDPGDWGIWLASKSRQQAEQQGAMVIDLPALRSRIMAALDDESLGFSTGAKSPKLTIADRQRLAVWLRAARAAFEPMLAALGLGEIAKEISE